VDLVWDLKMGKRDVRARGREPYDVDLISDVDLFWDVDLRMNDGRGSRLGHGSANERRTWISKQYLGTRLGPGSRFQTWISFGT